MGRSPTHTASRGAKADVVIAFGELHRVTDLVRLGQPGVEWAMEPRPIFDHPGYRGSGKLQDQVAIITGGDSGIGRAVAFAKEGADVDIACLDEHENAAETVRAVEHYRRQCLAIPGDLREPDQNARVVAETLKRFGKVHVLVNNITVQFPTVAFGYPQRHDSSILQYAQGRLLCGPTSARS